MKATLRSDRSLSSIVRLSWRRLPALIAGFGLVAGFGLIVPGTARAQGSTDQPPAAESGEALQEVIITARYKTENLQNVPQTVTAVTGSELQDLNLLNLTDLTSVVPGLQIINGGAGFNDSDTLRGLSFNPSTGSQNVAAFYVNDALVTNNFITTSNYDIGQIEVLEGPQGTLRGEPSPTGAITLATRPANLTQYGGYATVTGTQIGLFNAEAAVNLPIVPDKFALRLSGVIDKDPGSDVLSVNDPERPYSHTYSERASFAFQPIDALTANVMYQHLLVDTSQYGGEFGPGSPGGAYGGGATGYPAASCPGTPATTGCLPANYNGPPLGEYSRRSADGGPGLVDQVTDIGTANINFRFAGQQLTYVGSWWKYHLFNMPGQGSAADQVPGINPGNPVPTLGTIPYSTQTEQTQELRLASNAPDRFWDYTGGIFYREATDVVGPSQSIDSQAGSFGSPLQPANPYIYNPTYTIQVRVDSPKVEAEFSTFAHLAFHLPGRTEVTAGARYIDYNASGYTEAVLSPFTVAVKGLPAGVCAAIHGSFGVTYPNICNLPQPSSVALPYIAQNLVQRAWIYEASLSHKFTDNLLGYVNSGSSSRPGATAVGIYNAGNNPTLSSLSNVKIETSYAFEAGLKSTWLDNRARLNVSLYHQKYEKLIYYGLPVLYEENKGAGVPLSVGAFAFTSNPDAVVNGVDFDGGFIPIKNWTIDLTASFVHGHLTGSPIPCNPPNGGTTLAAFPAGTDVFLCPGHASTSTGPNFTATVQSQYVYPVTGGLDAFVRGLLSFYGRNPNVSIPPQNYTVPSYANLNLYLGLRSSNGAWQAMLFAENVLDKTTILNLSTINPIGGTPAQGGLGALFGPSGYYGVGLSARPQYGLKLSYAIGSR